MQRSASTITVHAYTTEGACSAGTKLAMEWQFCLLPVRMVASGTHWHRKVISNQMFKRSSWQLFTGCSSNWRCSSNWCCSFNCCRIYCWRNHSTLTFPSAAWLDRAWIRILELNALQHCLEFWGLHHPHRPHRTLYHVCDCPRCHNQASNNIII